MAAPSATSRYRFSRQVTSSDGVRYTAQCKPFTFRDYADNIVHEVVSGDTIVSVAGRYYGNAFPDAGLLYWIVADFQPARILEPFVDLEPGTTILLPSVRVVREEILSERRRVA